MAFLELVPVIAFFVAYKLSDIYWATAILIILSTLHIAIVYATKRTVSKQQLLTLVVGVVFGGMTLLLQDKRFIMYKPTLLYSIFAIAILVSQWMNKSLLKALLGQIISPPENYWWRVSVVWGGFYFFAGIANIYVANTMSEAAWVNFKVIGMIIANTILIFGTIVCLHKYTKFDEETK